MLRTLSLRVPCKNVKCPDYILLKAVHSVLDLTARKILSFFFKMWFLLLQSLFRLMKSVDSINSLRISNSPSNIISTPIKANKILEAKSMIY